MFFLAIPAMATPAGYFQVPGTDTLLKIHGQFQLREAYGLNGDGINTDLTQRSGPNDDTRQKGEWSGSWRSFLGVTTTTPSAWGDVVTKIYGRFNNADNGSGQSVLFNLEQAYVQVGGLKVGTDWSLFGYGAWEPNTLFGCYTDENGPWPSVRQITYLTTPMPGLDLGISLEGQNSWTRPDANFIGNPATNPTDTNASNGTIPNVSAVAAYTQDWGGVTLALNYQQAKQWNQSGATDRSGSGISWFLSGGWNVSPADKLTAMIVKGGAAYGAGSDGFTQDLNDSGGYLLYKSLAYNVSYTHTWNDQFSSALTVGQVKYPQETGGGYLGVPIAADDFKLTEVIVNTTWQFAKNVSFGMEYQHAQMKASNSMPFFDSNSAPSDTNKLDQFRFLLKATLF